mgnify:CR=1 FL=1
MVRYTKTGQQKKFLKASGTTKEVFLFPRFERNWKLLLKKPETIQTQTHRQNFTDFSETRHLPQKNFYVSLQNNFRP